LQAQIKQIFKRSAHSAGPGYVFSNWMELMREYV